LAFADSIGTSQQLLQTPEGKEYELVGPAQHDKECLGEGIGIALRKNNDELREKLNRAIDNIRADGTYAKIGAQYFPFDIYGQ
jgi:ABC-type amino acid transport substrate-binding protein